MRRGDWTESELKVLRENYGRVSPRDLARRLGRSVKSVYDAAYARGLTNRAYVTPSARAGAMNTPASRRKAARTLDRGARRDGFASNSQRLSSRRRLLKDAERPGCTTARQVRFCAALEAAGRPLTGAEVAAALGLKLAADARETLRSMAALKMVRRLPGRPARWVFVPRIDRGRGWGGDES